MLAALFTNNLLPIFLATAAGYLLSKWQRIDPHSLSRVIFYLFSPCLTFNLLARNHLSDSEILSMVGLALCTTFLVGAFTWLVGRTLHMERRLLSAVLLTTMFTNSGNYGLPVVLFAFQETALAYASIYFVTLSLLTYTVGVIIASMGTTSFTRSLANLLKVPVLYTLALGLLFQRTGWQLPLPIDRAVTLMGDAAIPCMLVLLGLQLRSVQWNGKVLPLALTNFTRLVVGPALSFGLCLALGISGAARQAAVLQAAMPTAVLTTVLATEYDVEPSFVTSAVFITTLLSPLTLTPLLALLGG